MGFSSESRNFAEPSHPRLESHHSAILLLQLPAWEMRFKNNEKMRAYHLTKAEHAFSDLRFRRLKIATFDDLNDPFELLAAAQPTLELRRGFRRLKEKVASKYGVLCFSKTWDSPVLWSHYGDRHRGIALGFDIGTEVVKEVIYKERRPTFRLADEQAIQTLLYTKRLDWQYEKEVRVFARLEERDETTELYFADFNENVVLREVITGPLCEATKEQIKDFLDDNSVKIIKGRLAFRTFKVVPDLRGFRISDRAERKKQEKRRSSG